MATIETAAVTANTFIALWVGHQLGDHPIQRSSAMYAKAAPDDERLATGTHPWTGWSACLQHVGTYSLAQAAALALVSLVAPLTWFGTVAALAASASTHAVIDRRWIVRAIIRLKQAQDWPQGPYLVDQSLHHGVLLVAAVLAATVTTSAGVAVMVVASAVVVAGALAFERRRARLAATRMGDPYRL